MNFRTRCDKQHQSIASRRSTTSGGEDKRTAGRKTNHKTRAEKFKIETENRKPRCGISKVVYLDYKTFIVNKRRVIRVVDLKTCKTCRETEKIKVLVSFCLKF